VIGEEAPSVPEQDLQYIVGLTSLAPIGRTFLENSGQAEAGRQQQKQNQIWSELLHTFNGLRRNTNQAPNRNTAM
jgi:hypothetical protein